MEQKSEPQSSLILLQVQSLHPIVSRRIWEVKLRMEKKIIRNSLFLEVERHFLQVKTLYFIGMPMAEQIVLSIFLDDQNLLSSWIFSGEPPMFELKLRVFEPFQ